MAKTAKAKLIRQKITRQGRAGSVGSRAAIICSTQTKWTASAFQPPTIPESERIEAADLFFRNTGARIIEGGARAYYDPTADEIHMPSFSTFKKLDYFYAVLSNEAIHNAEPGIMDADTGIKYTLLAIRAAATVNCQTVSDPKRMRPRN